MPPANVVVLGHPLILHKLTHMRDKATSTRTFRQLLREISMLMGYEIFRELPLEEVAVETPIGPARAPVIAGRKVAIVPVLRAGLGMADGLLELAPSARVGHIGVYRDHATKQARAYYDRLPDPAGRLFVVCDPMLATGNSAVHAVDVLLRHGVGPADIRFMALVAAPEGLAHFASAYPNVRVYVAAVDERLDENAYIVPGLGDAGDRLFGTD
jgi:uracil phosphoribosyltransferase